jgi:citrate lyase subunit beta / citryl-CoA lyase
VIRLARSYLYVTGDGADRLRKAHLRGADAIIADLEDSVAPKGKAKARRNVAAWAATAAPNGPERWVRVSAGPAGLADLEDIYHPALTGVCVAKASDLVEVDGFARALDELDAQHGKSEPGTAVMPLIESAEGLLRAAELAHGRRVARIQLGELDLAADLDLDPGADEAELLHARSTVVVASAAAGLPPPIAPVWPVVSDEAGFAESTRRLRRLGFLSRAVIHPAQLGVVHDVFTPTANEVREARRVITLYDEMLLEGLGVKLDDHGRMIDEAVVRRCRQTVALAQNASA